MSTIILRVVATNGAHLLLSGATSHSWSESGTASRRTSRREWVFAEQRRMGRWNCQLPKLSPEATELRAECYRGARLKRAPPISVGGREYEVRCALYDSFGEDAFRPDCGQSGRRLLAHRPRLGAVGRVEVE